MMAQIQALTNTVAMLLTAIRAAAKENIYPSGNGGNGGSGNGDGGLDHGGGGGNRDDGWISFLVETPSLGLAKSSNLQFV